MHSHNQIDPVQEKHYNVRNRVPDFLDVFQNWAVRSQKYRETAKATLDIRYGESPKSTLDLFLPENSDAPVPVHMFIHGGYWQALDKSDFSYLAEPFVNEGLAVAIVNYDLCPSVKLEHIVNQMRTAVTWLYEEGESHGIDPDNIHISGHSAGGQLVGELLATDWHGVIGHHVHNTVIKSCVAISGLYNLTPLLHTTINANVGLTYETAKKLSPINKDVHVLCPVLNVFGAWEGEGFEMQSEQMNAHWQKSGLSAHMIKLESATHFDAVDALGDMTSSVFQWAVSQMK